MQHKRDEFDNQVPELKDYNLYLIDPALQRLVKTLAPSADAELTAQGQTLGSEHTLRLAEDANRYVPELHTHSRIGERIDFVKFHPAWDEMMTIARRHGIANRCFVDPSTTGWISYAASEYIHSQIESGTMCPTNMTQAAIPVLREEALFDEIKSKLFSTVYDERDIPLKDKASINIGMGMTEKQGGSDLRAITTKAKAISKKGRGADYLITGHKWFFSAPMCDAHLVLAQTEAGPSCFFVPRWRFDGRKNAVEIQRLKDKVGNRSNASAEVTLNNAWGIMVGEEGRGIPTIIEMATYSRVNCALSSAGFLRQAFAQSLHYAKHRSAFGKRLVEQPLMAQVLADMALEAQAAMTLGLALARRYSKENDPESMAWRRIMTPAAKFWICKRAVEVCGEAMEVFGGNGYVEESPMGRLFREAPVNSIWEGSGNVMCLDVLRAIARNPADIEMVLETLHKTLANDTRLLTELAWLRNAMQLEPNVLEANARLITQKLVILMQACLLIEYSDPLIAEAFIATRTDANWGAVLGASSLVSESDAQKILALSWHQ